MACPTKGRVTVVTGSSSGIGKAIALGLATRETTLCLVGRNVDRLNAVADSVRARVARVLPCSVDLTNDGQVGQFASRLREEFTSVDVLVHSAGEFDRGKVEDAPVEVLDRQYSANVRAPYLLTQNLLPLVTAGKGDIVFINSTAGLVARAEVSQFSATQHALRAMADSLRQEVNPLGVRVLNVYLGRTATPRQARIYEGQGWDYEPELLLQPEDVAAVVASALALPRTAEVTEITIRPSIKSY